MRILALETSGLAGSAALRDGDRPLAAMPLPPGRRTAQTLIPAVDELVRSVGWQPRDLQAVAIAHGPGSFTGLRIGIVTAKTLAYALSCRVIGISTLETIAAQASDSAVKICAVLDAQRGELFYAAFARDESQRSLALRREGICAAGDVGKVIDAGALLIGPGLEKISAEQIAALQGTGITIASQERWRPQAETVAFLAWQKLQAGADDDFWKLAPIYGRESAATENSHRKS